MTSLLRAVPVLLISVPLLAQTGMTLPEVVNRAIENYPSVRVSDEQLRAAAAGIQLARTAYLPRTDFIAQANRATRNNVFGLLLPQQVLPTISGPPNPTNSLTSVWGSAVGILVSWEPFDFGLRRANVDVAEASRRKADASLQRTKFQVSVLAADAYLTILAAGQTLKAAQAQLERSKTVGEIVGALAKSELRPGADVSRSRAEIALAEVQIEQSQNAIETARITLRQLTGADVQPIEGALLQGAPQIGAGDQVKQSPVALEQAAAVAELEAQRRVLDRSYYPRFSIQGATYARGTGANPNGTTLGGVNGLGPNIHNWALGMTVTFPALDLPAIRVRKEIADHRRLAESARYDQVLRDLDAQARTAREQFESGKRIAALIPQQLEAARAAEQQATARYKAGLGTLIEVADAQRLLTQAEIDDALARLNLWRSALHVAAADGDLAPFLGQVK